LAARLGLLLSIIGPGIITANVDNDAGGITTYSVAGAHFGYTILWIMPLVAVALIIVQEMSARLGVVTGKGLTDLMREHFRVRITTLVVGLLLAANLANTVSEFAGVAASMEIFGIGKFISVPAAAVLVWLLIVRGNYKTVERVFLAASAIYLCYVVAGFLERPDWSAIGRSVVRPEVRMDRDYLVILVTIVGTTIAPWMQFYQQSAIADKGLKPSDYGYERVDVVLGSLFAVFVAVFITISCAATVHLGGARIETAADAAVALRSLAGPFSENLFAIGLLNASLFSAAILPLSTAYVVCEAFGWESGISRRNREAPVFFGIYTAFIVMGAGIVLLPHRSLVQVMMVSQTLNGILLPVILVVMLLLVNDRRLMGERFVNGKMLNAVTIAVVAGLAALTVLLVAASLRSAG
jgi:Mn2+/Fe2+ NRAMP family transporter